MPHTVVALHYWAGAGHEFDSLRPLLSPDTQLLAPDLPGFGQQPAPLHFDYSVRAYADWVAAYLAEHRVNNFTLLGHSMGGKIALLLAARRPAGLRRLVLLSPSPPSHEPMSDHDRAAALAAYGQPAEAEKTARKITFQPLPTAAHATVVADNLRTQRPAWDQWLEHGTRTDITAELATLAVPCHLLVGAHDKAVTPATQRRLTLPHLPAGSSFTEVPEAGHLLPLEVPTAVAAALEF
ncbi:alpha/beta hydrolase [Hymenobacter sp. DH14]|uniref:Alpha/beta hydrolase n=1 Tax=Hymenobacter cyanobacteriorum TaxID=2926463 RepID=A0A9X1VGT8_9BACT|nr:alpha/beta hydrolase [Hymenobacter cyanobacteriorum]MCI1188656.1 alpha/beta hydrolase [Hymenobacter cyanobacteriorum]